MTVWSGLAMNYGHQITSSSYDTTQIESDLNFLWSQGIRKLRIAYPSYLSAAIPNCQDLVARALAHGFYVAWGVATAQNSPNLTATIWSAYKTYVTGTLATWAQANGLSEFSMGNESDNQVDGTTLTAATVQSDVLAMCATVKSGGFTGKVSYNTTVKSAIFANWVAGGTGTLDLIGWNSYDILSIFTSNANSIVANFGSKGYVSEFGCKQLGFADYSDENAYATDTLTRITLLQSASIPTGYFFTYRDGGLLTANTYGLVQTNGIAHCVRGAILNTPGQKIFSMFGV